MPYEKELDKNLFKEDVEVEEFVLSVEVYQYNGNTPKIQISRMKEDKHLKLGRLTLEETNAIVPLLEKAGNSIAEGLEAEQEIETEVKEEEPATNADEEDEERRHKQMQEDVKEAAKKEDDKIDEWKKLCKAPIPEFRITLADPYILKDGIRIIKNLINEVVVTVDEEKISFVAMDPANVALVEYDILSSACTEYVVKEKFVFVINVENFYELLKNLQTNDILILKRGNDKKISVQFKGATSRTFKLPLIDGEDVTQQKVPELTFNSKSTVPIKELYNQIMAADAVSESILFTGKNKTLKFFAEGDINKFKGDGFEDDGNDLVIYNEKDITSVCKYNLEYLLHFLGDRRSCFSSKICDEAIIEFKTDYPLRLSFNLLNKLSMRFILAPMVENN